MAKVLVVLTVFPTCLATAWYILRRPFREICEEITFERARERFKGQRERLEARFLSAIGKIRPEMGDRWDEAHWQDEVVWARDRKTRSVLALVGVQFQPEPFSDDLPQYATALFEFRRGMWTADGRCLDEVRPGEAVLLHQRLEPVHILNRRTHEADGRMM